MNEIREWAAFALVVGIAVAHIFRWVGRHDQRATDSDRWVPATPLAVTVTELSERINRHDDAHRAFEKEMRERSDKAADRLQAAVLELEARIWRELAPRLDRIERKDL